MPCWLRTLSVDGGSHSSCLPHRRVYMTGVTLPLEGTGLDSWHPTKACMRGQPQRGTIGAKEPATAILKALDLIKLCATATVSSHNLCGKQGWILPTCKALWGTSFESRGKGGTVLFSILSHSPYSSMKLWWKDPVVNFQTVSYQFFQMAF